jgi:hypothetical protein
MDRKPGPCVPILIDLPAYATDTSLMYGAQMVSIKVTISKLYDRQYLYLYLISSYNNVPLIPCETIRLGRIRYSQCAFLTP